jgi:hypothetical protein
MFGVRYFDEDFHKGEDIAWVEFKHLYTCISSTKRLPRRLNHELMDYVCILTSGHLVYLSLVSMFNFSSFFLEWSHTNADKVRLTM